MLTFSRISLLCIDGSDEPLDGPAKQAEKESYEVWLQSERDKHQVELDRLREKLDYAPFTEEEWVATRANNYPKVYFMDIETEVAETNEFPDPVEAKFPINLVSLVSQ